VQAPALPPRFTPLRPTLPTPAALQTARGTAATAATPSCPSLTARTRAPPRSARPPPRASASRRRATRATPRALAACCRRRSSSPPTTTFMSERLWEPLGLLGLAGVGHVAVKTAPRTTPARSSSPAPPPHTPPHPPPFPPPPPPRFSMDKSVYQYVSPEARAAMELPKLKTWALTVDGLVAKPMKVELKDLLAMLHMGGCEGGVRGGWEPAVAAPGPGAGAASPHPRAAPCVRLLLDGEALPARLTPPPHPPRRGAHLPPPLRRGVGHRRALGRLPAAQAAGARSAAAGRQVHKV
jgi:hypothetical protein